MTGRSFAALAVPNFRRYVAGQSVSLVGTWVETVAQALLVLHLTPSGTVLGLATATRYLPILLGSPYAGVLVDRYDKRRILVATQVGLGVVSAALGVLVLSDAIRLWHVFALAAAFGAVSAVDNPARQAFVGEMVGSALLRNAVVLNSTSVNTARVLGPAIAAALVSTTGIGFCFLLNAASFAVVVATLLLLDATALHPTPRAAGRHQVRAGLRYAARVRAVAAPLLMMALVGTLTFEFEVSLPLMARDEFGGGVTYSWLVGALGAGAVVGGLRSAGHSRTGVDRLVVAAGAFAGSMLVLAVAPTLWTAALASALVGAASVTFLTTGNATVQLAADPAYRGRVTALWSLALVGSTAVGAPVVGAVADAFGARAGILLGALAAAAAAAVGSRMRRGPTAVR